MRKLTTLMIAAMIAVTGSAAAFATEYTKGTVMSGWRPFGKVI